MICDKKMRRKRKVKIYKTIMRLELLCGAEVGMQKGREAFRRETTEVRMLGQIEDVTLGERGKINRTRRDMGSKKVRRKERLQATIEKGMLRQIKCDT